MKKILLGIFLLVMIFVFKDKLFPKPQTTPVQLTNIRIGWQVPWATEGQLTQVLKNTDILQKNGLKAEFKGFNSGPPLNEAALAGEVDVIFTADQPTATLLGKNPNWVIIGRLMYNRVSLYVPPKSPIKTVADLKGKTVGMPFGAAAQRMALKAEQDAGLDTKKDVNNVNLDIYEQSDLVRDPEAVKWGKMDALAGFDPTPAIFEEKGLIRTLTVGKVISLIVMSKEYIQANSPAPVQFLKAFNSAYDYYRNNVSTADAWFTAESKLTITPKSLQIAAAIEPNLSLNSAADIRLGFIDDDYTIMQEAADFIFNQSLVKTRVTMKDYIDLSYLQAAALK
ncbi:MAG: NrtA/SsuA/CpmA family ABC transporter substrate-binding protein [Candidatus Beckwithbacteria bacterium]|nr:NrtA/SsuA/CpmA family ABC transporter substrate-binding protein [Candidatus Beckwithbacteria bacterium]